MTIETIQNVQSCLTVRKNGTSKKIVDVETLLKRHGNSQVLSLLLDLQKEKQKSLVALINTDESKFEVDETIGTMFRLHLAISRLEQEREEVKDNCQN